MKGYSKLFGPLVLAVTAGATTSMPDGKVALINASGDHISYLVKMKNSWSPILVPLDQPFTFRYETPVDPADIDRIDFRILYTSTNGHDTISDTTFPYTYGGDVAGVPNTTILKHLPTLEASYHGVHIVAKFKSGASLTEFFLFTLTHTPQDYCVSVTAKTACLARIIAMKAELAEQAAYHGVNSNNYSGQEALKLLVDLTKADRDSCFGSNLELWKDQAKRATLTQAKLAQFEIATSNRYTVLMNEIVKVEDLVQAHAPNNLNEVKLLSVLNNHLAILSHANMLSAQVLSLLEGHIVELDNDIRKEVTIRIDLYRDYQLEMLSEVSYTKSSGTWTKYNKVKNNIAKIKTLVPKIKQQLAQSATKDETLRLYNEAEMIGNKVLNSYITRDVTSVVQLALINSLILAYNAWDDAMTAYDVAVVNATEQLGVQNVSAMCTYLKQQYNDLLSSLNVLLASGNVNAFTNELLFDTKMNIRLVHDQIKRLMSPGTFCLGGTDCSIEAYLTDVLEQADENGMVDITVDNGSGDVTISVQVDLDAINFVFDLPAIPASAVVIAGPGYLSKRQEVIVRPEGDTYTVQLDQDAEIAKLELESSLEQSADHLADEMIYANYEDTENSAPYITATVEGGEKVLEDASLKVHDYHLPPPEEETQLSTDKNATCVIL